MAEQSRCVGDSEVYFYNVNVTYSKIAICVILNPKITIFSLYWAHTVSLSRMW